MLVIRLRRIGRKNDPHYRIVVAEHTAPVQGKFVAEVGHYHPKTKECVINTATFLDWVNRGAQPSNTVAKLARKQNITHEHITVTEYQGKPKKKAQEAAGKAQAAGSTPEASAEEQPEASGKTEAPEASEETTEEPAPETQDTPTEATEEESPA